MTSYDSNLPNPQRHNPKSQELASAIGIMAEGYGRKADSGLIASYFLALSEYPHPVRVKAIAITPKFHERYMPPAPLVEHVARVIARYGYIPVARYAATWAEPQNGDPVKAADRRSPTLPEIYAGVEKIAKELAVKVPTALLYPAPEPENRDTHKAIWARTNELIAQGFNPDKAMFEAIREIADSKAAQMAEREEHDAAEIAEQLKTEASG